MISVINKDAKNISFFKNKLSFTNYFNFLKNFWKINSYFNFFNFLTNS